MMPDSRRSQASIEFVLLGGFLGAGKTTALLRLAQAYVAHGLRVGIITNDQADGLVDTQTFRAAGLPTEEIPRGCFCCKFDDLIAAAGRLRDGQRPDVILAEPVGSCTDIVATVINPLRRLYADRFHVAPYVALLDPQRALQALGGEGRSAFSAKVTYIYKMQQHEADIVAINKIDTISPGQLDALTALVKRNFPKATVIAISARTGAGFDRLTARLDEPGPAGVNHVDVDYAVYTAGEARLGWLNATWQITGADGLDADRMLLDLATGLQASLVGHGAEPAHIKMILRSGAEWAIANVVSSDRAPELSRMSRARLTSAELILNARVEIGPAELRRHAEAAMQQIAARHGVQARLVALNALAPGAPDASGRFDAPAPSRSAGCDRPVIRTTPDSCGDEARLL